MTSAGDHTLTIVSGTEPDERWTERKVLNALCVRYGQHYGNGRRWAVAEHVRSHAGFDARRTADLITMDLWPSKGLELHGHEVKVSRADWLTELRDPTKADEFRKYMHRWWLVVPDVAIVRDDLPPEWGLMVVNGGTGARIVVQAPRLDPAPVPPTMLASLLRATAATAVRGYERSYASAGGEPR